ncbi:MAG TPA: glucose 1-dehydrogenase [Myxococcota bacterium]|nr:glucose 1-dehydrogenase [Myxococcota bacterium]
MRVQQLFDLSGRTALVTGGGRGLGRSIALGLAEAGADVFVASRKRENCEAVAAEIEALGRRAWPLAVDLGDPASVDALSDQVLAAIPRLQVLVSNSALAWVAPTLAYPLDAWERTFDVNVRGAWQLTQRVAAHMAERGGGSIIQITSANSYQGDHEKRQSIVAYNASKGALRALVKDLSVKLAPHGIRVNAIAPGAFQTAMLRGVDADAERREALLARIPLRRIGGDDDIKGAAVFLASEASAYVTGSTLVVDGGMLAL